MSHDYIALEWVKGEIEETLQQAQQALEAYVDNPQDDSRLKFCLSYLHQVHGTLQMVEFYGAALLAEEMEALAKALSNGNVRNEQDVLEVLMQAILQLPGYLEHVKVGRRDLPVVLTPILNELRAARGESLMSETALFSPDIPERPRLDDQQLARFRDPAFGPWIKKLRQMLQTSILHILRSEQEELAIEYLTKVFARLEKSLGDTPQGLLWAPALAFAEYLASVESIPKSAKPLLRQLDAQIRQIIDHGLSAINQPAPDELVKNILFYVAKSSVNSDATQRVRAGFRLSEALPDSDATSSAGHNLTGPDKQTVGSVVTALIDEITALKDQFDLLVRGDEDRVASLSTLLPAFKQIGDTMGMLGLGMPRRVLQDQQGTVARLIDTGSASDADLMDVAGALLYVEATLTGMQAEGTLNETRPEEASISNAQQAVLREARNVLEQVKDAIVEYIAKQWDAAEVEEVPQWLKAIEGSINMIPLPRAAKILEQAARFVEEQLIGEGLKAQWSVMDSFADILTSVEYYIERYSNSPSEADENLLQRAETALQSLPGIGNEDSVLAAVEVQEEATPEATSEALDALDQILIDDDSDEITEEEVELASAEEETVDDILPEIPVEESPFAVEPEEQALSVHEDIDVPAEKEEIIDPEPESVQPEPAVPESTPEPVATVAETIEDDDDDLIDDEIIEIFLEEAEEVLETLHEFWPVYKGDSSDDESRTTVRRAFHTLKGSGRMVQAEFIGELAWSVENYLNRVIDGTTTLSADGMHLIDVVISHLPELIDDFRNRRKPVLDTQSMMDFGDALSRNESVDGMSISGESPEPEVVQQVTEDIPGPAEVSEEAVAELTPAEEEEISIELPDSDEEESLLDDTLIDIFRSEAATHLSTVGDFIQESEQSGYTNELSDQLQRALHTLKGSAHMAGISPIALVASPLEKIIKELRAYQVRNTPGLISLLKEGVVLINAGVDQLETTPVAPLDGEELFRQHVSDIEQLLLAPMSAPSADQSLPDPQQLAQFLSQGMDVLLDADQVVRKWHDNQENNEGLARLSAELLEVSEEAQKAEVLGIATLATALHQLYEDVLGSDGPVAEDVMQLMLVAHEALLNMLDCLAASQSVEPQPGLIQQIEDARSFLNTAVTESNILEEVPVDLPDPESDPELPILEIPDSEEDVDPELLEIFLEEAQEIMESAAAAMQRWKETPDNLLDVAELQRELHTLKGGARMAEIRSVADLCHELESVYEGLHDGRVTLQDGLIDTLMECHDVLDDLLDRIRHGEHPESPDALIERVRLLATSGSLQASVPASEEPVPTEAEETAEPEIAAPEIMQNEPVTQVADQIVSERLDESDREILEIFLEEAQELQDELDGVVQEWRQTPEDLKATEEIQRIMHTLKGGARLGGLTRIGDEAHEFESWMIKAQQGQVPVDDAFFAEIFSRQDLLAELVDAVQKQLDDPQSTLAPVEAAPEELQPKLTGVPASLVSDPASDNTNVVPFKRNENDSEPESSPDAPVSAPVPSAANAPQAAVAQDIDANAGAAVRRAPQEMVKVSAELLDNLVNLAGETSISRGRLEQQVTDFSYSLDEMDSTLDRLRDQLRRLDMETEAQVLFRQEKQGPDYEDFDPLEMDRYSHMQQLARSLVESASDLLDIRESLTNKARDAETLLLQQSRVNTELQEGLMQTRMVPFQRLVPRLRRIVRQIGQELSKQVDFRVFNADGEMDRTILERLISPMEHMLRNAVDHGIENSAGRSASGKPAQGTVELRVERDGGDVLVTLKDDGRGIDVNAVRAKALERGLMTSESKLSDQEVMQFILHAGFSTAQKVTQISGRGVGMDVVNSEIKQMGGSLAIESEFGQGTEFRIRLPFTVSVNRALMVRVGDDLFAVPLDSIQGIVRVPSDQLTTLYNGPAEERTFEYTGRPYRLEYLGAMLGSEAQPKLTGQKMPVPVLLIQGDTPYALQVDSLLGSREIVVKNLGAQFGSVIGVSGGTILGDGSVVIILDLPAMMRNQARLEYQEAKAQDMIEAEKRHEQEIRQRRILVVDDSVTVRKVTTRLLERNGYEVFSAKDGVDAIATLQDHIPDLMLLDIEMPRMDGFEVASIVRHDSRLKHVPIIMITSRTGDKHRNRALSIGVNEYMGKPFQEEKLLKTIGKLLASSVEA